MTGGDWFQPKTRKPTRVDDVVDIEKVVDDGNKFLRDPRGHKGLICTKVIPDLLAAITQLQKIRDMDCLTMHEHDLCPPYAERDALLRRVAELEAALGR